MYNEITGDLIQFAKQGKFDVITHGCNCFCTMGAGIAIQMDKHFNCNNFEKESYNYYADINKLGTIDYVVKTITIGNNEYDFMEHDLAIVNSYTQFGIKSENNQTPLDYEALTLCLRKINHIFKGKHIGLPQIGCGLAGGDWNKVKEIIKTELSLCNVTVVIYG